MHVCPMQARLESQLSDLYHKLEQLQPHLCSLGLASSMGGCSRGECTLGTPHTGRAVASSYSPELQHAAAALPASSFRCDTLLSSTLPLLRGCCSSLLSLSLLVPAAPWVGGWGKGASVGVGGQGHLPPTYQHMFFTHFMMWVSRAMSSATSAGPGGGATVCYSRRGGQMLASSRSMQKRGTYTVCVWAGVREKVREKVRERYVVRVFLV